MSTMSNSPEIELLHRAWEAISGGDFAVLEEALVQDARLHGIEHGQLCVGRTEILEVMARNLPGRLQGRIEETIQAPAAPPRVGVQPPDAMVEPPEQRVNWLVPFVKVTDVKRSVGFYHHLGFTVRSVFKYRDRMSWAALESGGAEVMFEGTNDPIDHHRQGVLFHLYSSDLAALRDQLLAAGIDAGEIDYGSPGPREEMQVRPRRLRSDGRPNRGGGHRTVDLPPARR